MTSYGFGIPRDMRPIQCIFMSSAAINVAHFTITQTHPQKKIHFIISNNTYQGNFSVNRPLLLLLAVISR